MNPGAVKLKSGTNSRYKVEVFPRIWLYSDKPSLWQRAWFRLSGHPVIKLPDIDKCAHEFEHKTKEHHRTGEITPYLECKICEFEKDYEQL